MSPTKAGWKWISDNGYKEVLPLFALVDGFIASSYVEIGGLLPRFFTSSTIYDTVVEILGPSQQPDLVQKLIKSILRSKEDSKQLVKHEEGNRGGKEPIFTSAFVVGQDITAEEEQMLLKARGQIKTVSLTKDRAEGRGPMKTVYLGAGSWEQLPMEMQVEIVDYLPGAMLQSLRLVSSGMRQMADSPKLTKKLFLCLERGTAEDVSITKIWEKQTLFSITLSEGEITGKIPHTGDTESLDRCGS